MEIKLLVIRTSDMIKLCEFYTVLGLSFKGHQHGQSPYHYSATIGQTVIEIYPLAKTQTEADKALRLGFSVDDFDRVIHTLKAMDTTFFSDPAPTDFGYMAVVEDPDGRKVELYK